MGSRVQRTHANCDPAGFTAESYDRKTSEDWINFYEDFHHFHLIAISQQLLQTLANQLGVPGLRDVGGICNSVHGG